MAFLCLSPLSLVGMAAPLEVNSKVPRGSGRQCAPRAGSGFGSACGMIGHDPASTIYQRVTRGLEFHFVL